MPAAARNLGKPCTPGTQPSWIDPMLATLSARREFDRRWAFERKLDGVRCIAYRCDGRVRLMSRNKKNMNGGYPELVDALAKQRTKDFIVDGEIVAFRNGITSFEALQGRLGVRDPAEAKARGVKVYYYLFDLLYFNGRDATELPLSQRKKLLKRAINFTGPLRYSAHSRKPSQRLYNEACKLGLEGLIAKRLDAPYTSDRSEDWLKLKCVKEQELVIGGYTDPKGSREAFGALLLGYYAGKDLAYAGLVGTGFNADSLRALKKKLDPLTRATSPFTRDGVPRQFRVHWVEPKLVAQVVFSEWTRFNKLRHPRYKGLRNDKPAHAVVREREK
jgi:DNA ligase D-like protein (predicted ligase)